jgi:hypothetical protein
MKITLTELRNLVKNIIREEVSKEKPVKKSEEEIEQEELIKKVKKMVEQVNTLIKEVNPMFKTSDSIKGVTDSSLTIESEDVYDPIIFNEKNVLTISYDDMYRKKHTEKIPLSRLHNDGIENLMLIRKMYNSAKRKLQK